MESARDTQHQVASPVLGERMPDLKAESCRLGGDGQLGSVPLSIRIMIQHAADNSLRCRRRFATCSGGALLGALIVVYVEDQVVWGVVADLEVDVG